MSLDTLENSLLDELNEVLAAETQFSKVLRVVIRTGQSDELKQDADDHLQETLRHIDNLKKAFSALGARPEKGRLSRGAQGIVLEIEAKLREGKPVGALRDLALISGNLRIEHYEIAAYTSAISMAKALGKRNILPLLQENLKAEQTVLKKLDAAAVLILQGKSW